VDIQILREKLRDYEHVIETMHCGLVAEDSNGDIQFINRRLLDWLGYEREELLGQHIDVLVPQELTQFMEDERHAAEDGDLRARLLAMRRKDSTTFPVVSIPQHFLTAEGNFDGYFSIVVDLGAVMTARQVGPLGARGVCSTLHRISLELQSLCLTSTIGTPMVVPLHHPALQEISPRESEVLSLLVAGDRVPGIAERLHISQHTVRNHLKSMFRKLDIGTQSALIEFVRKLALDPPSTP
jgi:PAS domain S-box-containing protein